MTRSGKIALAITIVLIVGFYITSQLDNRWLGLYLYFWIILPVGLIVLSVIGLMRLTRWLRSVYSDKKLGIARPVRPKQPRPAYALGMWAVIIFFILVGLILLPGQLMMMWVTSR